MPVLRLPYRPPYDWDYHARFYSWYAVRPFEQVSASEYRRDFQFAGATGEVSVRPDAERCELVARYSHPARGARQFLKQRLTHLFDLEHDPATSGAALARVPELQVLLERHPGVRLPTGFNAWESALSVILGQLISVKQAQNLLHDLLAWPEAHTPEGLCQLNLDFLKTTRAKKIALQQLAAAVAEGTVSLAPGQALADFGRSVLPLRGIGPWSASCMAMRCLGHSAACPSGDLVIRRALEQLPADTLRRIDPYGGYLAALLWRHYAMG